MGGFMVVIEDGSCYVVMEPQAPSMESLGELLENGKIIISEKEIADKGRGDAISKGLVLVQTTWVILQCIACQIQQLPITELEVVTMAYVVLNLMTYFLWWHKPQNVGCPVLLCDPETIKHLMRRETVAVGTGEGGTSVCTGMDPLWSVITEKEKKEKKPWWPCKLCTCGTCPQTMVIIDIKNVVFAALLSIVLAPLLRGFILFARLMGNVDSQMTPRIDEFIQQTLGPRFLCQFGRIFGHHYTRDNDRRAKQACRVHNFYAGDLNPDQVKCASYHGLFVAMAFGGIHCLAWLLIWNNSFGVPHCLPLHLHRCLFPYTLCCFGAKVPTSHMLSYSSSF